MDARKATNGNARCKYHERDLSQRRNDTWKGLSMRLSMIIDHFNNKRSYKPFRIFRLSLFQILVTFLFRNMSQAQHYADALEKWQLSHFPSEKR